MKEYEYSFKVKDLNPYIKYLKNNEYIFVSKNLQIRELYKNKSNIMARITIDIENEIKNISLDFKDDKDLEDVLKVSKESIPLIVKEYNIESVKSILEILGYKKYKTLNRSRTVYKKNNVKFELDSYTSPDKMFVVGIDGENDEVEIIYKDVKNKMDDLIHN